MSMIDRKTARRTAGLSIDATLGIVGCCLAAASAAFGVAMTMHGPLAEIGKSGNFTVFAQLAPSHGRSPALGASDDLDTTQTASIPQRGGAGPTSERATIPSVKIQSATANVATLLMDGRPQIVRVGDHVDGLGEILSIVPGERPVVQTSRGLIASVGIP